MAAIYYTATFSDKNRAQIVENSKRFYPKETKMERMWRELERERTEK